MHWFTPSGGAIMMLNVPLLAPEPRTVSGAEHGGSLGVTPPPPTRQI